MPDIEPKDAPKVERKEFTKSARIAVTKLNEDYQRQLAEIVGAVGEDLGLKGEDGWRFDAQTLSFQKPAQ